MTRTVVFYGDSNTYGFDPRGFSGGRYPEECIWTNLVQAALPDGWTVRNEGMNGRRLPNSEGAGAYLKRLYAGLSSRDLLAVMLGTNDLLMSLSPDAAAAAGRMEALLREMTGNPQLLILAPVHIASADAPDPLMKKYYEESLGMNALFGRLAEKYGVFFADAGRWNIDLAFDGVHFSEKGHRVFAEHILEVLDFLNFRQVHVSDSQSIV